MEIKIGMPNSMQATLSIPISFQQAGWQYSQQFCTSANQWHGYLNYLCLAISLPWLSTTFGDRVRGGDLKREAASGWELVDGSIVIIGQRRLCLLPHTSYDCRELRVPREWIDIPSWIADYYLAVQLDLDAEHATIWGHATHAQIQQYGIYDDLDRTYCLGVDQINNLSLTTQLAASLATRGLVEPISSLDSDQASRYLNEWSSPQLTIPRLEISEADFPQWLSLLAHDHWRQQLVERRVGLGITPIATN